MNEKQNRLADETSPYLQQHADNPVDWFPWGDEALAKARAEDKPVLLSVGYSACHWCHVMAHESFEDEATAALMNELFVNIKVDREERPDLDKIYQTAQVLLTRRTGGWPLTMFLTPDDQAPFFGGTYFPKEQRHGMPAFQDVLRRVHDYYRAHRDEIRGQADAVRGALGAIYGGDDDATTTPDLSQRLPDAAARALERAFDPRYGGFGGAPKFPQCAGLAFLLDHWARRKGSNGGRNETIGTAGGAADPRSAHVALFTLERMGGGGLYDQLGGGFYRYSVDERWAIPHFEKMLYDNGPLLGLLAQAWGLGGGAAFGDKARETARWVMREMQSPEGGYYSTLDADSPGGEGAYYTWDRDEVERLLGADYAAFEYRYGLDMPANFEGRWHLAEHHDAEQTAAHVKRAPDEVHDVLERARQKLVEHRHGRPPPGRDEKILTSWNALMIKGMAQAAWLLDEPEYAASARRALSFIRRTTWRDGRLLATFKDGTARLNAYLDDYAFLVDAILYLNQAAWDDEDFRFAVRLADVLLDHYEDRDNGGFYFTSHDHERLLERPRVLADEATPSGYGVAALALGRLGGMLGDERYLRAAARALARAAPSMERAPEQHATLVRACAEQLQPPEIVIIRGQGETLRQWLREAARRYHPARLCFAIPARARDLPRALDDKRAADAALAYPCRGTSCAEPLRDLGAFADYLEATAVRLDG